MKNAIEIRQKEAYDEARLYCEAYVNYKGDKRKLAYKQLQRNVVNLWMGRMNNFGKILGLPLFSSLYD